MASKYTLKNVLSLYTSTSCKDALIKRFWKSFNKTTGCWVWVKKIRRNGYGTLWVNPKGTGTGYDLLAHRISYELHNDDFDPTLWVLHKCDNPACVNPDHLYQGTPKDNTMDMVRRGRAYMKKGQNSPLAKLTKQQVQEILNAPHSVSNRNLSCNYGVSEACIGRIRRRETWKDQTSSCPLGSSTYGIIGTKHILEVPRYRRKFYEQIEQMPHGCWNWIGTVKENGICVMRIRTQAGRISLYPHRIMYDTNVRRLRRKEHVMRTCGNPVCVKPAHLKTSIERKRP